MLALLQYHYDWKKRQVIKPPSLTELQQETGLSRTTVRDHRYWLETHGWLTCTPPPVDLSRREHARTAYELHLPGSDFMTEVRAARPAELGAAERRARLAAYVRDRHRAKAAELAAAAAGQGAARVIPSGKVGRGGGARARAADWTEDPGILAAAANELAAAAGHDVEAATVAAAVRSVLAGRTRADVRNPAVYVTTSIRKDPRRFLPVATPPPVPRTPDSVPPTDERRREILASAGLRRPVTT